MEHSTRNRTIALAALFQCIDGVIQLANNGTCDEDLLKSCINSILIDDAISAEALYGGLDQLKPGLSSMMYQLGSGQTDPNGRGKQLDATQYSINVLALEKKLSRNPEVFRKLMDGIAEAQKQLEFYPDPTHTNMIARLADLYTNTISTLGPRIMIKGDQNYLTNTENAAKMRTLLLAGIRAALLWNQAGGSRWKLLFERGKMQREADNLLKRI
ncbi:high frequency lysogenization protein HflD [Leucothrix pacifica]|uniref:High frequency lysogenization protein HflD homolog n=1 Tax=Leucothrix pacifica TaxID=1247513 RepID=A0A317CN24_9GAMM|nr:high frequency lysogenization protein HflD [Leucothrix pacifica]PWQ97710.1 lysogenization regulator HflD [Leucothrix pacifica]